MLMTRSTTDLILDHPWLKRADWESQRRW